MRRILIVLLMMVVGVAHARILHVGENTIKLSQTKTTTPALHVRVGDEVWYGAMVPIFVKNTLHVRYNNVEYSVLQCAPFTDTTNYTYDESGRLIGANENVYLESTGTQWIQTNYWPMAGTSAQVEVIVTKTNGNQCYGGCSGSRKTGTFVRVPHMYFAPLTNASGGAATFYFNSYHITSLHMSNGDRVNGYLSVNPENTEAISIIKNLTTGAEKETKQSGYLDAETTITLYGTGRYVSMDTPSELAHAKMFYYKIWQGENLVRHFVPVPCGLKIGDFVVPENGMWDIVEQKFYGNSGTGDFIYGVDG